MEAIEQTIADAWRDLEFWDKRRLVAKCDGDERLMAMYGRLCDESGRTLEVLIAVRERRA